MPGAFRSEQDLVNAALANLGVLAPGQPVDIEDYQLVQSNCDSIYRKLNALEICYVPDPQHIPGAWFADLADIVAGEMATKFGSNPEHYMTLIQRGLGVPPGSGSAAVSLKQITRGRPSYEVLQTDYF